MSRCRMFAGIDWASLVHVACVVGPEGEVVDRFDFHARCRGNHVHDPAVEACQGQRGGDRAG
jgi:hypothetical protein